MLTEKLLLVMDSVEKQMIFLEKSSNGSFNIKSNLRRQEVGSLYHETKIHTMIRSHFLVEKEK